MTLAIFREGSWKIRLTRDERSGKSELEAEVSRSGAHARITCREKYHLEAADVDVEFTTANGIHIHPEERYHFHRGEQNPTVLSSAAAYIRQLMGEIGDNPAAYLARKLLQPTIKTT